MLAAESVILFILGTLRKNIFLQTGAYISGAMAVGWGIDGVERNDPRGLWLGVTLGAMMALNAFWSHWRMVWADRRELRPVPAYFTLLALVMWCFTTWQNTTHANFGLVLAHRSPRADAFDLRCCACRKFRCSAWATSCSRNRPGRFDVPKLTAREFALALAANCAALLGVGWQRKSPAVADGRVTSRRRSRWLWGIAGLGKIRNRRAMNAA